jgi:FkbH-like protein
MDCYTQKFFVGPSMKLIQALETVNRRHDPQAETKSFYLACGFTPLHLITFLRAHLQLRFPLARVDVETGLYGDLQGNLERSTAQATVATAVVLEWSDLDPRLGMRHLGGWNSAVLLDILDTARNALLRVEDAILRIAVSGAVVFSPPTLPLAPCFAGPGWAESAAEAELREAIAVLSRRLAEVQRVQVLNVQRLQQLSPAGNRYDLKSDLKTGFPYHQGHAETLAALLASAMELPQPFKGLITDLDNTLWQGILGEVGPQSIAWDLAAHAQTHGLYQQFLDALAERGVLVGAASKNDPTLVQEALRRSDIRIQPDRLFPIEANWGPKSDSVSRILRAWNIAAEAVVFIDDSPHELAEVKAGHPRIHCIQFPDAAGLLTLLEELRDRFGKRAISEEDRIRSASIRQAALFQETAGDTGFQEAFLRQTEAAIQLSYHKDPADARALELVNKTNQFNLNGQRFSESEWQARVAGPNVFLATVSYRDKFGPLGKVAVLMGTVDPPRAAIRLETWVMSCRAFSRRIEHQCLFQLFHRFKVEEVVMNFVETPRNTPIREFLTGFGDLGTELRLTRSQFEASCPPLYHSLDEVPNG